MVFSKDLKKAICFGLIIGALISFCNLCFASESEETINYNTVSNVSINTDHTQIISGTNTFGYFELQKGYIYTITRNSTRIVYMFSNDLPGVGVDVYNYTNDSRNESIVIDGNVTDYVYFVLNDNFPLTVTREKSEGLSAFVDRLAYNISFGDLSNILNIAIPIVAISVLFGLGVYFIKRIMNKTKRAKGGI